MLSVIIAIYADATTLYSKCDLASDLWQEYELASKLESDIRDTVHWGKKWLVGFNAGKTQLVSFDQPKNNGSICVKMDGSVLEGKSSFKMLRLTFSLNWIGVLTLSITKTASKKIRALIRFMKFLSPEVALYLCKCIIHLVWNTVVTSELEPLVATWNCQTSQKNGGLLVILTNVTRMSTSTSFLA